MKIENREARFEMKQHFATAEEARNLVEPFIREWEFAANLEQDRNKRAASKTWMISARRLPLSTRILKCISRCERKRSKLLMLW